MKIRSILRFTLGVIVGVGIFWLLPFGGHDNSSAISNNDPLVVQDKDHPCGPTAVALIAGIYGLDVTLDAATDMVPVDPLNRTSLHEMGVSLKRLGLHTTAAKLSISELRRLGIPAIAHLKYGHFVVTVPNQSGHMLVLNPPYPPTSDLSAFTIEASGAYLLVHDNDAEMVKKLANVGLSVVD